MNRYAFFPSRLGECFVSSDDSDAISKLLFVDGPSHRKQILAEIRRFPAAKKDLQLKRLGRTIIEKPWTHPRVKVNPTGTAFQKQVWKALQSIKSGRTSHYSEIARRIRRPSSVRAVANAIGANPIAVLVPCHRVLRKSGALGGYRGGLWRKKALLRWEQSQHHK